MHHCTLKTPHLCRQNKIPLIFLTVCLALGALVLALLAGCATSSGFVPEWRTKNKAALSTERAFFDRLVSMEAGIAQVATTNRAASMGLNAAWLRRKGEAYNLIGAYQSAASNVILTAASPGVPTTNALAEWRAAYTNLIQNLTR